VLLAVKSRLGQSAIKVDRVKSEKNKELDTETRLLPTLTLMKPRNIVIVRHGQSEGNANPEVRRTKPDYALNLTPFGEKQAEIVGKDLKDLFGDEKIGIYCSPYFRTKQTLFNIRKSISDSQIEWIKEDPRIREQEWGNLEQPGSEDFEQERDSFGKFFYRFPNGESGGDVYDRCTGFLDTLYRDFEKPNCPDNILIVCHGFTMRVLLARWLHLDVETFQRMKNPENCGCFSLFLNEKGKYEILKGVDYYCDQGRVPYEYSDQPNSN